MEMPTMTRRGENRLKTDRRKLALLRRADTERDSKGFSISGNRKRKALSTGKTPSMPRLKSLEHPIDEDEP